MSQLIYQELDQSSRSIRLIVLSPVRLTILFAVVFYIVHYPLYEGTMHSLMPGATHPIGTTY